MSVMAPFLKVSCETRSSRQVVLVYTISFIAASPRTVNKMYFYWDIVVRTVFTLLSLAATNA